ncbi:unnamed protein product [Anisakis simplex]|uniref:M20_dimer domain-containing protein n=1 Tax=Anisakis simplex TaxID=6269 RepID=A0A0M3K6A6_ANISI|nr:unnamed protein product [Anisakis simplex]
MLYAVVGKDPAKKTVLIYGHLDVQPADIHDGWNSEPFQLVERDGKLFGRGSTDDKGPVVGWINVLEAFRANKIEIPVNIKFCLEGMEESGSLGLEESLKANREKMLSDVSFTCISDNYWLGTKKPCITYGLRGNSYYCIEIIGSKQDLHSGVFGGALYEPMSDLVWMMSQLIDLNGKILIDGVYDMVPAVTDAERALYENIDFDEASSYQLNITHNKETIHLLKNEYRESVGAKKLMKSSKVELLMSRWRNPSLSLHGVEGAFSGVGAKTVIPSKVIGKFSIRTVPNMDIHKLDKLVYDYTDKKWKERGSPNQFKCYIYHSGPYWLTDPKHPNFQCGARAIKRVYGVEPDYTREGGSIPITLTFEELTAKNVMLLPMGAGDDMAHSQNEKIDVRNYMEGTKMLAAYLLELGTI